MIGVTSSPLLSYLMNFAGRSLCLSVCLALALLVSGCVTMDATVVGERVRGVFDPTEGAKASSDKAPIAKHLDSESPDRADSNRTRKPFSDGALYVGNQKRVALIIGNAAYDHSPLLNPRNDAIDIGKALEKFGFQVTLVTDGSNQEMRNAIRVFGERSSRADVALFYFAGHGVQIRGVNYLVPVRESLRTEAEVEDRSISADFVLRTMEGSRPKVNIVILDACRDNPFISKTRSGARGLASMDAPVGTILAFSTSPGAVAYDGSEGRNGLYTKHLLLSLAEDNTDIAKIFQRPRAGVLKESVGKQVPWETTSLIGDFYFSKD